MRRFHFHYNKLASRKAGKPQVTLHYKGKCILVDNIKICVNIQGKINKRQPYFVMTGSCSQVDIVNNEATIY